jgi:predicted  nucleic acid-binding Zn-ribbon protein
MLQQLKVVLDIQEYDMKMIRLMRLKRERMQELEHISALRHELHKQQKDKEAEIADLNRTVAGQEMKISDIKEKLKKLEARQSSVKKVDEFNAITQETTQAERERIATELITSDLIDKRNLEEEILTKIKESLQQSEEGSIALEAEIKNSIRQINQEGAGLKSARELLAKETDPEILRIYERLLNNKKDRVVVPIENRTCSGCYIALTAQHENVVRKGERLVFCEHCSRIHYWQDTEVVEGAVAPTKRRRRKLAGV